MAGITHSLSHLWVCC